jgi:hypothetical protein
MRRTDLDVGFCHNRKSTTLFDHLPGASELLMLIACAAIWLTPITGESASFSPLTMRSITFPSFITN